MPAIETMADGKVQGTCGSTTLRWNQISSFEPGATNILVYGRTLAFLRDIWPAKSIEHLAPRAALQVNGAALQKVARLDPAATHQGGSTLPGRSPINGQ